MTREHRLIPDTWFQASGRETTMDYLSVQSMHRQRPLAEGERQVAWLVIPPFQRPPVWSVEQKARFVESCWMKLPVGVFVYNRTRNYESRFNNWLLDGQQRVTAIVDYMADAFPVFGHLFSELTEVDHRFWGMGTKFPCLETNLEDETMLREVYDRLAYGGTPHLAPSEAVDAARYRWLRQGQAYVPEEQSVTGGPALDAICDRGLAGEDFGWTLDPEGGVGRWV